MSAAEVLKKLRINTAAPLCIVECADDCEFLFDDLETTLKLPAKGTTDQLMLFARDGATLLHYIPRLQKVVTPTTLLWICYPKKSGAYTSDLIRMEPWQPLFDAGFRGQTSVSINDNWTGMRFTNAPKTKASLTDLPQEERKAEGIDFIKRTVTLPIDAEKAIAHFAGMRDFFYSRSFTFKKEVVLAILDAKKAETRERRINKLIDELKQGMLSKK